MNFLYEMSESICPSLHTKQNVESIKKVSVYDNMIPFLAAPKVHPHYVSSRGKEHTHTRLESFGC